MPIHLYIIYGFCSFVIIEINGHSGHCIYGPQSQEYLFSSSL